MGGAIPKLTPIVWDLVKRLKLLVIPTDIPSSNEADQKEEKRLSVPK